MAFAIASNVAGIGNTGRPTQGHVWYARNQGAWWWSGITGTQSLSAAYSTNGGTTWTAPTGSPVTLTAAHNSEGRNFGFDYAGLASNDVLHLSSAYAPTGSAANCYHSRYTLGTTWTQTNAEGNVASQTGPGVTDPAGNTTVLDSTGLPIDIAMYLGGSAGQPDVVRATGTDSGSAWTAGWGTPHSFGSSSEWNSSSALFSLGSGNVLAIFDNASSGVEAHGGYTNLNYSTWSGSSWSGAGGVFSAAVTATSPNNWGACARSTSDIHVVSLSDNASAYVHYRYNGTSWSAGDTIPTLALQKNATTQQDSGVSLVSNGTNVWAAAIDTSANVQVSKWTSGTGWSSWAVQEAARTTPAYITGAYDGSGHILWAWTENTGSQFNVVGTLLSTGGATAGTLVVGPFPSLPPAFFVM